MQITCNLRQIQSKTWSDHKATELIQNGWTKTLIDGLFCHSLLWVKDAHPYSKLHIRMGIEDSAERRDMVQ